MCLKTKEANIIRNLQKIRSKSSRHSLCVYALSFLSAVLISLSLTMPVSAIAPESPQTPKQFNQLSTVNPYGPAELPNPSAFLNILMPIEKFMVEEPAPYRPTTIEEVLAMDIAKSSDATTELYEMALPEAYHVLIPDLIEMDKAGINGIWVSAIIITEVGRESSLVGKNNYFNWTVDTITYSDFATPHDCMVYAQESFLTRYFNPDWHKDRSYCQWEAGKPFTIERINEHYAINADLTVNWLWSQVVAELMLGMYQDMPQVSA